jgi:hypothetical protein
VITLKWARVVKVIVEDRARNVEALFVVIFDGVAFMAVDIGALAQQERELRIRRYVWHMNRPRRLEEDVIYREAGKDVVGYVFEFAIQQALETGDIVYGEVGSNARDLFNCRHG